MEPSQLNWIANFIWGIADDVLRDLYVRGKYRDVILPMTVLRRLDAVLEPTKPSLLDMKASLDKAKITNQDQALRQAAGQAFYNTSRFTLRDLKARASQQQLKADFEAYLDGFSPNVQDILENFEFRNQIPRLSKADALGTLIEKFLSPDINLSPNAVLDGDGSVKQPGLDNHGMGTVFEELVRRFNEENNEEAGEHWTPRASGSTASAGPSWSATFPNWASRCPQRRWAASGRWWRTITGRSSTWRNWRARWALPSRPPAAI